MNKQYRQDSKAQSDDTPQGASSMIQSKPVKRTGSSRAKCGSLFSTAIQIPPYAVLLNSKNVKSKIIFYTGEKKSL